MRQLGKEGDTGKPLTPALREPTPFRNSRTKNERDGRGRFEGPHCGAFVLVLVLVRRPRPSMATNSTHSTRRIRDPPQILPRIQARRVSIRPPRLDGITADRFQSLQVEGIGTIGTHRRKVGFPENILFSHATRAGAKPAQSFERDKALGTIRPPDCEFRTDHLTISWLHGPRMNRQRRSVQGYNEMLVKGLWIKQLD